MKKSLFSVAILLPIVGYSVYKMLKAKKNALLTNGEMYLGSIKYLGGQKLEKAIVMDDGRFICNGKEEPKNNIEITFLQSSKIKLDKILDICIARNNTRNRFYVLVSGYYNNQIYVRSGWMSEGQV